jgi:hypothetical protein
MTDEGMNLCRLCRQLALRMVVDTLFGLGIIYGQLEAACRLCVLVAQTLRIPSPKEIKLRFLLWSSTSIFTDEYGRTVEARLRFLDGSEELRDLAELCSMGRRR